MRQRQKNSILASFYPMKDKVSNRSNHIKWTVAESNPAQNLLALKYSVFASQERLYGASRAMFNPQNGLPVDSGGIEPPTYQCE